MSMRECGWNFQGPLDDLWHLKAMVGPVKHENLPLVTSNLLTVIRRYLNTVTGEEQRLPPQNFRGGILGDQMGLGKTLSTIALIANDQETLEVPTPREQVRTTLVVVRAPRE